MTQRSKGPYSVIVFSGWRQVHELSGLRKQELEFTTQKHIRETETPTSSVHSFNPLAQRDTPPCGFVMRDCEGQIVKVMAFVKSTNHACLRKGIGTFVNVT